MSLKNYHSVHWNTYYSTTVLKYHSYILITQKKNYHYKLLTYKTTGNSVCYIHNGHTCNSMWKTQVEAKLTIYWCCISLYWISPHPSGILIHPWWTLIHIWETLMQSPWQHHKASVSLMNFLMVVPTDDWEGPMVWWDI